MNQNYDEKQLLALREAMQRLRDARPVVQIRVTELLGSESLTQEERVRLEHILRAKLGDEGNARECGNKRCKLPPSETG